MARTAPWPALNALTMTGPKQRGAGSRAPAGARAPVSAAQAGDLAATVSAIPVSSASNTDGSANARSYDPVPAPPWTTASTYGSSADATASSAM